MTAVIIRFAQYADLPAIGRVMGQAFFDDSLFGEIIHPHRQRYPEDVNLYWLRRAYADYWNYRWRWLVAVVKEPATGKDVVVGVAAWERLGSGGETMECASYDPRKYLKHMFGAFTKIHAMIYPNRAISPINGDILDRAYPCFGSVWSGDRAEGWYLEWLAVHPDYQYKGIGKRLAQWGLDRAEEEQVWASVVSAEGKEEFYRDKCGFNEEYWSASMGEGNPLAAWNIGRMFWRRPSRSE